MMQNNLERFLASCPEVDCQDHLVRPEVSNEDFMLMEQAFFEDPAYVHIYPFVRQDKTGKGYIDLYIWDLLLYPGGYKRFIICDGYRLPEEEETVFFEYIDGYFVSLYAEQMQKLNEQIMRMFPFWHYCDYSPEYMRDALKHMYYSSHRSGVREILYKANLNRIASNLDKIPSYNLIGSNPRAIIGYDLPLKLLRILNQPFLVSRLFSEDSIELCRETYDRYSGYIGRKLPSYEQWEYLERLCSDKGVFAQRGFIRSLYEMLHSQGSRRLLNRYEQFFTLLDELSDVRKVKIPKPEDVLEVIEQLEAVRNCREDNEQIDELFKKRKIRGIYEFEGKDYSVVMPGSSSDICYEAIEQGNCLMDYIEDHAKGDTTILFVRRHNRPDEPFVTMEVKDNIIEQVYGRFNSLPDKEVYEFLKDYSSALWLMFDPYMLITDAILEYKINCSDELWKYAEDFRKRNYPDMKEPAKRDCYKQITIDECFPQVFSEG